MERRRRGKVDASALSVVVCLENGIDIASAVHNSFNPHIASFSHVEDYIVLERHRP
ncbi:hypothetical protein RFM68_08465 [Mesorhizobium sp. MSK_1335]|uniref:Uncharacterized protein n=1 Tax=Mesorhizobium montanum TaxID=3072323 RepID=A0ABU4ZGN9_9HYPH|nr:hypothetical protein [Mesorhizobium sp. MSK_1335]MDX8524537.1 hypothetical protein [Mesorhizobium sp. MSK_1335]